MPGQQRQQRQRRRPAERRPRAPTRPWADPWPSVSLGRPVSLPAWHWNWCAVEVQMQLQLQLRRLLLLLVQRLRMPMRQEKARLGRQRDSPTPWAWPMTTPSVWSASSTEILRLPSLVEQRSRRSWVPPPRWAVQRTRSAVPPGVAAAVAAVVERVGQGRAKETLRLRPRHRI